MSVKRWGQLFALDFLLENFLYRFLYSAVVAITAHAQLFLLQEKDVSLHMPEDFFFPLERANHLQVLRTINVKAFHVNPVWIAIVLYQSVIE